MKAKTLSDIAANTGWSVTTVSRVLSGNAHKYRIPPSTVRTVMEEARRSGYLLKATAQNLRKQKSNIVGLLLPSVSNPYFADIASGIITELSKSGFTTIIIDTMEDSEKLAENAKSFLGGRAEGIIAVPCGEEAAVLEMVNKQLPVVLVDRYYEDSSLSYVVTNNYQGGKEGTQRLLSLGHRRIACIQGVPASTPNKERVKGFLDALREERVHEFVIAGNDFSIQNGYLETKLLLNAEKPPTAIFALSNTILMGAYKAIAESGLRIPEDISVLSFDDNIYMDYMTPAIERIGQPVHDMAVLAVKILIDKINGFSRSETHIRLTPSFIRRASVSAPRDETRADATAALRPRQP